MNKKIEKIDIIEQNLDEHKNLLSELNQDFKDRLIVIAKIISKAIENKNSIYWCGNGGSAADCQHLAAEFVGRFEQDRKALNSIALTCNSSILTCISNDYSYDKIFSRQIEALGKEKDVLIAISTSGLSKNISLALQTANSLNMTTISLLGKDGGVAKEKSNHCIIIPSNSTARIQEIHILIGHIICSLVERDLGYEY